MGITGFDYLDAAIKRHSLYSVAHFSPIQGCCEITPAMIHEEVVQALRSKKLLPPPYCISKAIESFLNSSYSDSHSIFVHRISFPNGEPICWVLVDNDGKLLEQAYCKHHGNFSTYCRLLVDYIVCLSQKSKRYVAYNQG